MVNTSNRFLKVQDLRPDASLSRMGLWNAVSKQARSASSVGIIWEGRRGGGTLGVPERDVIGYTIMR